MPGTGLVYTCGPSRAMSSCPFTLKAFPFTWQITCATAFIERPLCSRYCADPWGRWRTARHSPCIQRTLGLLASVLKAMAWPVGQPRAVRFFAFALVAPFPLALPVQTLPPSPVWRPGTLNPRPTSSFRTHPVPPRPLSGGSGPSSQLCSLVSVSSGHHSKVLHTLVA